MPSDLHPQPGELTSGMGEIICAGWGWGARISWIQPYLLLNYRQGKGNETKHHGGGEPASLGCPPRATEGPETPTPARRPPAWASHPCRGPSRACAPPQPSAPCLKPSTSLPPPRTVPRGGKIFLITFHVPAFYHVAAASKIYWDFPRHGLTVSLRNWTV